MHICESCTSFHRVVLIHLSIDLVPERASELQQIHQCWQRIVTCCLCLSRNMILARCCCESVSLIKHDNVSIAGSIWCHTALVERAIVIDFKDCDPCAWACTLAWTLSAVIELALYLLFVVSVALSFVSTWNFRSAWWWHT